MIAQLATVKSRLAIPDADTSHDALLTAAIKAVSARFDKETNRALARTENATHEFDPADTEISPPLYPIETVTKWETKSSESEGWVEQSAPDFLIRSSCVIPLSAPINYQPWTISHPVRAQRAKPKSRRDDMRIAQGKRGTSAALGSRPPRGSPPLPIRWGEGGVRGHRKSQPQKPQPGVKFTPNASPPRMKRRARPSFVLK